MGSDPALLHALLDIASLQHAVEFKTPVLIDRRESVEVDLAAAKGGRRCA